MNHARRFKRATRPMPEMTDREAENYRSNDPRYLEALRNGTLPTCMTRRVRPTLTWEQYCEQVGADPQAARGATLTSALCAMLGRLDAALDVKPSERRPTSRPRGCDTLGTADLWDRCASDE